MVPVSSSLVESYTDTLRQWYHAAAITPSEIHQRILSTCDTIKGKLGSGVKCMAKEFLVFQVVKTYFGRFCPVMSFGLVALGYCNIVCR